MTEYLKSWGCNYQWQEYIELSLNSETKEFKLIYYHINKRTACNKILHGNYIKTNKTIQLICRKETEFDFDENNWWDRMIDCDDWDEHEKLKDELLISLTSLQDKKIEQPLHTKKTLRFKKLKNSYETWVIDESLWLEFNSWTIA